MASGNGERLLLVSLILSEGALPFFLRLRGRGRFGLCAVPHEQAKEHDVLFIYQYGTYAHFLVYF